VKGARQAILARRPTLVLLHSTFPYLETDGTGLFGAHPGGLPEHQHRDYARAAISGSLLYRSGCQPGIEMIDMADDLITTDFTSDMIQSVVLEYVDRRAVALETARCCDRASFAFVPSKQCDESVSFGRESHG